MFLKFKHVQTGKAVFIDHNIIGMVLDVETPEAGYAQVYTFAGVVVPVHGTAADIIEMIPKDPADEADAWKRG